MSLCVSVSVYSMCETPTGCTEVMMVELKPFLIAYKIKEIIITADKSINKVI